MKRTAKHYAQGIVAAIDAGSDLRTVLEHLRTRLRKDRARKLLPRILRTAIKELELAAGIRSAAVTVAREEMKAVAQNELSRSLGATISLTDLVRPDIIGGAIVRVDDTQVDGTVAHSLAVLRATLTGNAFLAMNQSTTNHDETA